MLMAIQLARMISAIWVTVLFESLNLVKQQGWHIWSENSPHSVFYGET